jgi:hydrogenase maturation protein HypF
VQLPGGEQAVRQPWRVAASYLAQAYGNDFLELDIPFTRQLDRSKWPALSQMMARHLNSPATSSLGRLFDAISALLGVRGEVVYEGQAAIELEALAQSSRGRSRENDDLSAYPFSITEQGERLPALLDVKPLVRAIADDIRQGVETSEIAMRFHCSIAELLATACLAARERTGLDTVALSGGVFQNRVLLEQLMKRLEAMAFRVYTNRRVPPNDGGLALGQLAVAAARLQHL